MPAIFILLTLFFTQIVSAPCHAGSRSDLPAPQASPLPFTDDLGFKGLTNALETSCSYYENSAAEQIFELCGQRLSGQELSHSYRQLINRLQSQPKTDIGLFLQENFTACRPTPLLITGYYTPILAGSLQPSNSHRFALYAPPPEDHLRTLSRAAISTSNLLQDYVIAYLTDPIDLFFLHVQGSGIIAFEDGSRRLASYAGDNGMPYTSIGKILIQEDKVSREEISLATIRHYLASHTKDRDRILNRNKRYIFFRLSAPKQGEIRPTGSLGYPLTTGRSVAMDSSQYPAGILGYLTGRRPHVSETGEVSWQAFSRLVTHHDSGAAITGRHRLDLYMGNGQQAGQAAGLMKERGDFAILIPNLSLRPVHSKIDTSQTGAANLKTKAPVTIKVEKPHP